MTADTDTSKIVTVVAGISSQEVFGRGEDILLRMISDTSSTAVFLDSQIPSFVRDDHPKFVDFMKAYYDWMNIPGNTSNLTQTIKQNQDIDTAEDNYVEMLHKEFLSILPRDLRTDRKQVLKYIKHFYRAKGTENSFRLFFRMLYDTNVEFYYPRSDVLKVSDGKWIIEKSIRVVWETDTEPEFDNKIIVGETSKSSAFVDRAFYIRTDKLEAQELFLNVHGITGKFLPNEVIVTQDGHRGRILPVLSKVEFVENPFTKNDMTGSGYQLNDEFYIRDNIGHQGKVKVVSVDEYGAIRKLSISNFGLNYQSDVVSDLDESNTSVPLRYSRPFRYAISNNPETFSYSVIGEEAISVVVSNFASKESADRALQNFKDNSFVNLVGTDASTNTKDEMLMRIDRTFRFRDTEVLFHMSSVIQRNIPATFEIESFQSLVGRGAKIKVFTDALCVYPGYYINNNGQLSASKYLHDNHFYQQYSYRLYSKESSDTYRIYLNSILHPLGLKFFAGFRDPSKVSARVKTLRGSETKRTIQPFSPKDNRDVENATSFRSHKRLEGGIVSTSVIRRDGPIDIISSTLGPSNRSLYRERFNYLPKQYELLNQNQQPQTIDAPSVCVYDTDGELIQILDVPEHDVLTIDYSTEPPTEINYWGDPSTTVGQYANMQMYLFNSVVPKSLEASDVPDVVVFKNEVPLKYDEDYIVHHRKSSGGHYQMKLLGYTLNPSDSFYVSFKDRRGQIQIKQLPFPKTLENQNEFFHHTSTQEVVVEVPHDVGTKGPNSRINILPESTITKGT